MRARLFLAAVLLATGAAPSLAAPGEAVWQGVWKTAEGENVSLYPCGSAFCIKINTGEFAGKIISSDLMDDGEGNLNGSILDPSDDKVYSGTVSAPDERSLKLRGCALRIFCQSVKWSRVE